MGRRESQYDVGEEEQQAAAARLGVYRMTNAERTLRWRLRKAGIIQPHPWLAADLEANCIRDEATGCLVWQRNLNSRGYGKIKRGGVNLYVHRLSLENKLGRPLAAGMVARHTCDNPPCMAPEHLIEGTQRENIGDQIARGRHRWQRARKLE
jgi:hypothetical protein